MLILHVTFRTHPGQAKEFVQRILEEGIAQATESEAGNGYYDFYISAEHEDVVMLLEQWDDQESLDAHTREPHFKRINELEAQYVVETIVEKYIVQS